jgi:hypothetical protein
MNRAAGCSNRGVETAIDQADETEEKNGPTFR